MAVYSMTGYASTAVSIVNDNAGDVQLSVEIRSVNSRFLDVSFRLPEDLRQAEPELRSLVTSHLKRGKVEIRASHENSLQNMPAQPSQTMLATLLTIQKDIQSTFKDARGLSVADVMRIASTQNNYPQTGNNNSERSGNANELLKLTKTAVADLLASRAREGARLTQMLNSHVTLLRTLISQAGPLIPMLVAQQRDKFMDRWREALSLGNTENKVDQATTQQLAMERALNEATAFALRIDVAEELIRLSSHLDEIERILHKGGETGKKLDFLIQELHREANTLGSKSSVLELSRISVDMKVLIEQMREQVQNLE